MNVTVHESMGVLVYWCMEEWTIMILTDWLVDLMTEGRRIDRVANV